MGFLPAAFLLSLLLAAHGEYLQPPETSLGSNLFSSVTANSTCDGVSYIVLTPLGSTNSTGICSSVPAAAIDGALSSQWLSAPGDNVVEFTIGVSVSHSHFVTLLATIIHCNLVRMNVSVCLDSFLLRQLKPSYTLHVLVLCCIYNTV